MIRILLSAALLLGPAAPATAQAFGVLEGLFKSVNSVSFSMQGGRLDDRAQLRSSGRVSDLFGLGTEVYLNLPAPEGTFLELSLGTSYLRGFEATEPSLDLRGSVRALPTISLYATHLPVAVRFEPYVGVNFGLLELWNTQAYTTGGQEFGVKAQTYEYGGTIGVNAALFASVGLFLEANYKKRRFASIDWGFPGGLNELPEGWPRSLNLSGPGFSLGLQFDLNEERRQPPPAPAPPALAGAWALAAMDGQDLPALFEQRPTGILTSTRTEVLTGTLVCGTEPDDGYTLLLQLREVTVNAEGHAVEVTHPRFLEEAGRYRRQDGLLLFSPRGEAPPHTAERVGNDLQVRLADTNHVLLFKKPQGAAGANLP